MNSSPLPPFPFGPHLECKTKSNHIYIYVCIYDLCVCPSMRSATLSLLNVKFTRLYLLFYSVSLGWPNSSTEKSWSFMSIHCMSVCSIVLYAKNLFLIFKQIIFFFLSFFFGICYANRLMVMREWKPFRNPIIEYIDYSVLLL